MSSLSLSLSGFRTMHRVISRCLSWFQMAMRVIMLCETLRHSRYIQEEEDKSRKKKKNDKFGESSTISQVTCDRVTFILWSILSSLNWGTLYDEVWRESV